MERKADQQNKNLSEELKQGLPRIAQANNAGGITLTFPLDTECDHLRLKCFYLLPTTVIMCGDAMVRT